MQLCARCRYKYRQLGLELLVEHEPHSDSRLPPQRWHERFGQRMHQPQHLAHDHGNRVELRGLFLCLEHRWMGAIFEYLLLFGNPDSFRHMSPQRRHDGCRRKLLGHKTRQQPVYRRLFVLFLHLEHRQLERFIEPLLIFSHPNTCCELSPLGWNTCFRFKLFRNEACNFPHCG